MIQGENFRDWLKNRENRESFPPQKFCRIRYITIDNIFSDRDSSSYTSLVPSIANLHAKEKGDALAKQAIVFAKFSNLERVFLG